MRIKSSNNKYKNKKFKSNNYKTKLNHNKKI